MRQANAQQSDSYSRQVDKAFMAIAGVSYAHHKDEFESSPVAPRIADAISHDMSPAEFALRVSNRFGLRGPGDDDAIPYNRRMAALVEFSSENPDWVMGRDGAVYREGPEGIERLSPGRDDERKRFVFEASVAPGGVMDTRDGMVVGLEAEFERVDTSVDIGDAVEKLESRYGSKLAM